MSVGLPQQLEVSKFAGFMPHRSAMMLLDRVESWDDQHIVCSAVSHLDAHNPLRVNGRLSHVLLIEYTAQAAAMHLAIRSVDTMAPILGHSQFGAVGAAYLAVTRNFRFAPGYLDDRPDTRLLLEAKVGLIGPRIYRYDVRAHIDGDTLGAGTISLVTGDSD